MRGMLDRIELSGFKSIRHMDLKMRELNVLIGANGSGKSNFISLFELTNHLFRGDLQLYVGKSGADSLLHYGSKHTEEISSTLSFTFADKHLFTYHFQLQSALNDTLIFSEEAVRSETSDKLISVAKGHKESMISHMVSIADQDLKDYLKVFQFNYIHQFHDTSPEAKVHKKGYLYDNIALRHDAGNLAAFLYKMKTEQEPYYRRIVSAIQLVAPFFGDFVLVPSGADSEYVLLRWQERGSDLVFGSHQLSDGTLRFIALVTLLLQPQLPPFLFIDEPELGLHPAAVSVVADLLRSASKSSQVIVATQSVPLVNHFDIEDLIIVERKEGQSVFERKKKEDFKDWLEEYELGELWEMNVLGGRPMA